VQSHHGIESYPPRRGLGAWIDVRGGVVAGLLLGGAVAVINASHGLLPAGIAGLKQGVYTFFFGGAVMQLCARMALRQGPDWRVMLVAIGVPSLITSSAIFVVHNLRGTPEPLLSCLPVVLLSPPGFALCAWQARRALRLHAVVARSA